MNQVIPALEALRELAGERRFLLVGDSKLVSYPNLTAIVAAGVQFVAPASKTYVPATVLAGCDRETATPVAYVAQRDAATPVDQRGSYGVTEDTMTLHPPKGVKGDPLVLRRVFVWSSARAGAAATARDKKLRRARGDLERLTRGLGGRHYPTVKAVEERVAVIGRERRVKTYLRTTIGTDTAGKPTLAWEFDQETLDSEAATDGWYALLTNLDPTVTAAGVLERYKGQEVVERRYGDFKGPLAVAPLFLKTNRRIEALITVICLALLIFSLAERAVRIAIHPLPKLDGMWAGRPAKPTARLIFGVLARLRLIPATRHEPAVIPQPPPLQARLLELLDVDPLRPR